MGIDGQTLERISLMPLGNANNMNEGLCASKPCRENVKYVRQRGVRLLSRKQLGNVRYALISLGNAKIPEA
jgi:hypothetical protein